MTMTAAMPLDAKKHEFAVKTQHIVVVDTAASRIKSIVQYVTKLHTRTDPTMVYT